MDNRLIEKTGFIWDQRTLLSTFLVLKFLFNKSENLCCLLEISGEEMLLDYQTNSSYDDIIESYPDIKELLPIEPPKFKILQKFYYGQKKFALINSINVGFLRDISWPLYANCIDLIFFQMNLTLSCYKNI